MSSKKLQRNFVFFFNISVFLIFSVCSASEFWSDSFEDYQAGSSIKGQGGWDTWDGNADPSVSGVVSDVEAATGDNSLLVSGSNDVVRVFQGIDSGVWLVQTKVFIPSTQSGNLYFILLNNYTHGGPYNWSVQIRMSAATGLVENLGGSIANGGGSAVLEPDTWHTISVQIDLDNNLHSIFFDQLPLHLNDTWAGGDNSMMSLAAMDLFSEGSTESYFDDVAVYKICTTASREVDTGHETSVRGEPAPLYKEGDKIKVTIKLSTEEGEGCEATEDLVVTEVLPELWTAENISSGGSTSDGRITWEVPKDQIDSAVLSYEAKGPVTQSEVPIFGYVEAKGGGPKSFTWGPVIVTENGLASNGDILSWLFLGPFQTTGSQTTLNPDAIRGDFLTDGDQVTEENVLPEEGDTVDTDFSVAASLGLAFVSNPEINPDGVPQWFAWRDTDGRIDFDDPLLFGQVDNVMCYAVCYVCAEEEMPVTLYAGSDDAIQIILNHEEVWINAVERAWPGFQDIVPVTLASGRNRLMVKIFETGGGWNFGVRIRDEMGIEVPEGVSVTLDPLGCEGQVPAVIFKRGDANADGDVNIADAVSLLGHLFAGEPPPSCADAADSNDDGNLNIADAVNILGYLFGGSGPLPDPGGETCGEDPTEDSLPACDYPQDKC